MLTQVNPHIPPAIARWPAASSWQFQSVSNHMELPWKPKGIRKSWPWYWMLLLLFIVVWQLYDLQCCHLEKSDESRDVAGDIEMINRSRAHVRSSGRRCLEKQRHRKVCFTRTEAFETFVFFFDAWDMLRCNDVMIWTYMNSNKKSVMSSCHPLGLEIRTKCSLKLHNKGYCSQYWDENCTMVMFRNIG